MHREPHGGRCSAPFEEVAEVRVNLREFFLPCPVPSNGIEAKFSMPYCVSIAFLDGCVEALDELTRALRPAA